MSIATQFTDRIEFEGWQDYLLVGALAFVGIILLVAFFRSGGGGSGGNRRKR